MLRRSAAFPLRSQFFKHCIGFRQAASQRRLCPSHFLTKLRGQFGNYLFLFRRRAFAPCAHQLCHANTGFFRLFPKSIPKCGGGQQLQSCRFHRNLSAHEHTHAHILFYAFAPAVSRSFSFSRIIGPSCETLPAPNVRIMSPSCATAADEPTASANELT